MESAFIPGSNSIFLQALLSICLLCGVFYLSQWLMADFLISMKERRNMRELGNLIVTSLLLFIIVCCHFPYTSELTRLVSDKWTQTVALVNSAAGTCKVAVRPNTKSQRGHQDGHGRLGFGL